MTLVVNIHNAKTQFSELIERVVAGEEVIIAKDGKPVARLVPYSEKKLQRVPGSARGKVTIENNFDEPLSEFESL